MLLFHGARVDCCACAHVRDEDTVRPFEYCEAFRITTVQFELGRVVCLLAEIADHGDAGQRWILRVKWPSRLDRSRTDRGQIDITVQRQPNGAMADVSSGNDEAPDLFFDNAVK